MKDELIVAWTVYRVTDEGEEVEVASGEENGRIKELKEVLLNEQARHVARQVFEPRTTPLL